MMNFSTNKVFSPISPPAVNRVSRFYITRELGRGTASCVYLGHDPVIDRDVAVKTFNPKLTPVEKKQYDKQLINEARAAGRLSHPNIITIFEASSEGGTTYIAMEYLQGCELSKVLDSGHRYTYEETASIIWRLADGLAYAHKNGVVHRDIKPGNIFIVGDNKPKIVDFGIARSPNRVSDQPANGDEPYSLFHNNLLGTPNYMSPEQATGRPVDFRTDVYSLGAVMYEMLVGHTPFHSHNTEKLLQLIAHKAPPAPNEVNSEIPAQLSEIVMKAMSKRPEKRYQDAAEMVLDIKRYLTQERRVKQRLETSASQQTEYAPRPPRKTSLFWISCLSVGVAIAVALSLWLSKH